MRRLIGTAAGLVMLIASTVMAKPAPEDFHFQLLGSTPKNEAVLEAPPTSIELWFSEEPDMAGTRIRLMDHHDERIELGNVMQDAEDPTVIHASIKGDAGHGGYTIYWRGMGKDGHVVTGELTFEVETSRGASGR